MPCEKCSKDSCMCAVDEIVEALMAPQTDKKDDGALAKLKAEVEELKRELTLMKTAMAALIHAVTTHETRTADLEKYAETSSRTATMYYDWVLKLIDHTGLIVALKKKNEEKPQPPPPAAEPQQEVVTTQSYEAGKSTHHENMYG